jgi:hypothetical protein
MASAYRPVPVTLEAVQFDGSGAGPVRELVAGTPGVSAFLDDGGRLVVRRPERPDRIVPAGWWVSRTPEGMVTVHSPQAFSRLYEAA